MRGNRAIACVVFTCLFVGALCFVTDAENGAKEVIRVIGAESAANMVDSFAKEFMNANPNCNIVVSGGSNSQESFTALFSGETELVMQSIDMREPERDAARSKGIDLQERIIGWGGIVIIVNPSNPVTELTVDQVRKIFTGEAASWKEVGGSDEPVTILTVGDKRIGTLEYFTREFLKAPIAQNAITKAFFKAIVPAVEETKNAAGYVRVRNILQLKEKGQESKIKIVAIKKDETSPAVLPTRETVNNGTYPVTRPYLLYANQKNLSPSGKSFLEFCASRNPRLKTSQAR
jgi:phosphate transport system substrate-binding protein